MRALGVIMAAVAVVVSAPADGAAQADLSGAWDFTVVTEQGDQPLAITIAQEGQELVATGNSAEIGPIEMTGTLDGSNVRLEWELYIEGMELYIVFTGNLGDDGTISGTMDLGDFGQGRWSAKRAEG